MVLQCPFTSRHDQGIALHLIRVTRIQFGPGSGMPNAHEVYADKVIDKQEGNSFSHQMNEINFETKRAVDIQQKAVFKFIESNERKEEQENDDSLSNLKKSQ